MMITLKSLFDEKMTFVEYFSLGLAGWMLPISLISTLWFLLGFASNAPLNRVIIPIAILSLTAILFRLKLDPKPEPSPKIIFVLLTLVLISILIRLAFVSQAIFPSYFDSAQHYSIIKGILQHGTA